MSTFRVYARFEENRMLQYLAQRELTLEMGETEGNRMMSCLLSAVIHN